MCNLLLDVEVMQEIENFARKHSDNSFDHGWPHVMRVLHLAEKLAKMEKANIYIVRTSALLHDIGRLYEKEQNENHALISARMAKELLDSLNVCENCVEEVIHAIKAHSFSLGVKPKTIEAKVLSDADKLDAMGAVGIIRAVMFNVKNNRDIEVMIQHFFDKLLTLKDLMNTESAKKLAEDRHQFMVEFIERLKKELAGI